MTCYPLHYGVLSYDDIDIIAHIRADCKGLNMGSVNIVQGVPAFVRQCLEHKSARAVFKAARA